VSDLDAVVNSSRRLRLQEAGNHRLARRHRAQRGRTDRGRSRAPDRIGGIPDAVLPFLNDRKDLAVHSELVSDGVIPLIESGVITGARKNFKPRKSSSLCPGSKNLFDFVDNNPSSSFIHGLYQRSRAHCPQRQDGGHQLRFADRLDRPGLLGLGRNPLL